MYLNYSKIIIIYNQLPAKYTVLRILPYAFYHRVLHSVLNVHVRLVIQGLFPVFIEHYNKINI